MAAENQINYIEIPVADMQQASEFLARMFGWQFQHWGDDYYSFNDGHIDGGLSKSDKPASAAGVLLVFYSNDLERDVQRVKDLGGTISEDIFSFPGGRRFHFFDPSGNQYAMWSE